MRCPKNQKTSCSDHGERKRFAKSCRTLTIPLPAIIALGYFERTFTDLSVLSLPHVCHTCSRALILQKIPCYAGVVALGLFGIQEKMGARGNQEVTDLETNSLVMDKPDILNCQISLSVCTARTDCILKETDNDFQCK